MHHTLWAAHHITSVLSTSCMHWHMICMFKVMHATRDHFTHAVRTDSQALNVLHLKLCWPCHKLDWEFIARRQILKIVQRTAVQELMLIVITLMTRLKYTHIVSNPLIWGRLVNGVSIGSYISYFIEENVLHMTLKTCLVTRVSKNLIPILRYFFAKNTKNGERN